jgi:hypothetical protein
LQGRIAQPAGARWAEHDAEQRGEPARRFADFSWTAKDSWSRRRRVVAKAEWMPDRRDSGANPRFVVTSLKAHGYAAQAFYEQLYRARGEPPRPADRGPFGSGPDRLLRSRENRIKECQLDLFADRTSAETMRANRRPGGLRWPRPAPTPPRFASPTPDYQADCALRAPLPPRAATTPNPHQSRPAPTAPPLGSPAHLTVAINGPRATNYRPTVELVRNAG